ncbi:MAG: hypothetical protein KAW67_00560 [Candidatus Eisenbacteria sp.]|nr:hypothetical protein [Candidatus Eisenbacteria bacterium]
MTERVSTGILSSKHRHGMVALVVASAVLVFAAGCAQKGSPVEVEDGTGGYRIVGTLAIAGYAEDVEVDGSLCVLAAGQGGLVFVDVSDPANPEYLSTGATSYPAMGCAYVASDSLAFAAIGAQGIYVYDVSDLLNPVWQSNGQGIFTRDVVTREVTPGDYHEVLTADGYGIRTQECYYYEGLETSWFFRQADDEGAAGVARGICSRGNLALLAIEELGLSIYDVTDVSNVLHLGGVDTPGEARAAVAEGDYVYVADWRAGLQVVDISDPSSPEIVASADTDGMADGIAYRDGKVYVAAHTGGLRVFDVTDPTNPRAAGFLETPFANNVFVTGSNVYVADRDWGLVVAEEE